jgi:hypothetical protein
MLDDADVVFTADENARFETDLQNLDIQLGRLATMHRCTYEFSAGRGWPGRRFSKRVWLKTYVLKVMLNPDYIQDQQVHYEIRDQWMYSFGVFLNSLISHNLVAKLQPETLRDDAAAVEQLIRDQLAAALG